MLQDKGAQVRVGLTYDLDADNPMCTADADQIAAALESLGHEVIKIGSAKELVDKLAAGQRFDVVFNGCLDPKDAAHEAQVPVLLSIYGVACTFSSPMTINICSQRSTMKSLLRDRGVPTSDYWLVETLGDIPRVDATYPVMIGPTVRCCSSKCIPAKDATELSKACCQIMVQFATPALIEPMITGQSFLVALLGNGISATVLMPTEVPTTWANAIERTAKAAWRTVGGCDAGCVTVHCDSEGQPHVMNIAPLPSLAVGSPFMKLAQAAGMSIEAVIHQIMETTAQRVGVESGHPLRRPHMVDQVESASVRIN